MPNDLQGGRRGPEKRAGLPDAPKEPAEPQEPVALSDDATWKTGLLRSGLALEFEAASGKAAVQSRKEM